MNERQALIDLLKIALDIKAKLVEPELFYRHSERLQDLEAKVDGLVHDSRERVKMGVGSGDVKQRLDSLEAQVQELVKDHPWHGAGWGHVHNVGQDRWPTKRKELLGRIEEEIQEEEDKKDSWYDALRLVRNMVESLE